MQERKTLKLNEASSGWLPPTHHSVENIMSNENKKRNDEKTSATDPKKLPLPAMEQIEEISETDLDGVAGGCATTYTGGGGGCGGTTSRNS